MVRPEGISSTEEEHRAALDKGDEIVRYLTEQGWPEPLIGDSGNGGHCIYKINLENTPENIELLKCCLKAISTSFSSTKVQVDEKVFDPPRITKLYGTTARKGDNIPLRPHRPAKIISLPEEPKIVSYELLKSLADTVAEQAENPNLPSSPKIQAGHNFDVQGYLEKYDIDIKSVKQHGSSTLYILQQCLFNSDHAGGESAIGQNKNGKLFYQCFHSSCKDRTWAEARKVISGDQKLADFMPYYSSNPVRGNDGISKNDKGTEFPKRPLPAPPPFPLDVFPRNVQAIIKRVAEAYTVPVEIPSSVLLVVSGACIGQTRGICIKKGWVEHPNLFLVSVGRSGTGKSPATKEILRHVFDLEEVWYDAYLTQVQDADSAKATGQTIDKPQWRQLMVEDASPEALSDALASNPRGILWYRDELSGLFLEMDKYSGKNGGTKTRLMSAYDSGSWKVNRITSRRNLFIPHATLSLYGTIQPTVLHEIFSNQDSVSGFLPRFLFLRVDRETPPFWSEESIGREGRQHLSEMLESFLEYQFTEDTKPLIVPVSAGAKTKYVDWYNQQVSEPWLDLEAACYEALLAKLRGQCLRLCLILHCMDSFEHGRSEIGPVSEDTMDRAIRLANCFKEHQKQVWQYLINPSRIEELSPLQKRVIRGIVHLQNEIRSGMLPTGLIAEKINEGIDNKFHVSTMSVGKAAASLGFATKHMTGATTRGICISSDDIDRLRPFTEQSGLSGSCGVDHLNSETASKSARGEKQGKVNLRERSSDFNQCQTDSITPAGQDDHLSETTCTGCTTSLDEDSKELSRRDMVELRFNATIDINSCFTMDKLQELWESEVDNWSKNLSKPLFEDLVKIKNRRKKDIESNKHMFSEGEDEDDALGRAADEMIKEMNDSLEKSFKI